MRVVWMGWLVALAACADGEADKPDDTDGVDTDRATEAFPRCADSDPLRRPFFGDTHVHTALSLDANLQGTRLGPMDAYRFSKGEQVGIQPYDMSGAALRSVQLERPLDFVALSDHAEFLGAVSLCQDPTSSAYDHQECKALRDNPNLSFISLNGTLAASQGSGRYPLLCGDDPEACLTAGMDVWADIQEAAEAHYDRTDACTFTTFVGYEWSGNPGAYNLHRNVIFRNEAVPALPIGYFDENFVQGLWSRLQEDCLDGAPCDVLTIPHNSNLSNGLMFQTVEEEGAPRTAAEAALRARMEPLVEIFQHKGDSECWPGSSASDELCDFEKLPYNSLSGANLNLEAEPQSKDFVRDILGEGLRYLDAMGANPYRYGIIASTDTHLATPGLADEADFPGHGGAGQQNRDALPAGLPDNPLLNPGGLAVLWAEENSRESLFRAMRRREAYGTSGPRIELRLFAGWELDEGLCEDAEFVAKGYAGGVPMGGDLPLPAGTAPRFAIAARADLGTEARPGAPLQRLQVVKGWLEDDALQVQVFDVAGDADNGAGVDLATCEPEGSGSTELCTVWTDPAFDADEVAFYYVRAVENPTCRWTTRQCVAAGISCPTDDPDWGSCCDDRAAQTVQERAWSSPVWYLPAGTAAE